MPVCRTILLWIKAAARKYPYMDVDRVGIYGCSAGGQESTNAVLLYPDFYKAAYSACGCHDNRMDKIWWNELWLGYPVGDQYKEGSNVENAHLLSRPLMLVVGELDDNVDPASTMQVVNALIKANKGTIYEYPVSEMREDIPLNYDGVRIRNEVSFQIIGETVEDKEYMEKFYPQRCVVVDSVCKFIPLPMK